MLVMRQLKRASPLARIVATLGMLIVIQSLAVLRYGARVTPFQSELPENPIHIAGINVSVDRFILLGIAIVLTIGLHLFYAAPVRHGDHGGGREPAGGLVGGPVAGPDRGAQLGARLGAGRCRRHPDRPDRVAPDRGDDQHRPRRAGRRAGRRLPQLPAGAAGRSHPRRPADRGRPVHPHTGRSPVAAGARHRRVDDHPGPGPAAARLLPAAPAFGRQRPHPPRCPRHHRGRDGDPDQRRPRAMAGRVRDDVRHRHHPAVGGGHHRLRRAAVPRLSSRWPGSARWSPAGWRTSRAGRSCSRSSPASWPRCPSVRSSRSPRCARVASTWPSPRSPSAPPWS